MINKIIKSTILLFCISSIILNADKVDLKNELIKTSLINKLKLNIYNTYIKECVVSNYAKLAAGENYLNLIGLVKFNDGLGRIPLGMIDCLKNDIKINVINTQSVSFDDEEVASDVLSIVKNSNNKTSKIVFVTEIITTQNQVLKLKDQDNIKIMYSMFETTKIPSAWVDLINNNFDIAGVPDEFLVEIYKNSGIKIPIFVLPLGVYLKDFEVKKKLKINKIFSFGCLSRFQDRKNQALLIEAFAKEFGNSPNVILRLHGRFLNQDEDLKRLINKLGIKNIKITSANLPWKKYIEYMTSLDCYVNISKGEGYSLTPREALAAAIPCILTRNTAQTVICDSGFVKSIDCNIKEIADYSDLFGMFIDVGYFYNCSLSDTRKALRDVYNNYSQYLSKAKQGSEWVKQYGWERLRKKYLSLIKPKKIVLGNKNILSDDYLMTDSRSLFEKYKKLMIGG